MQLVYATCKMLSLDDWLNRMIRKQRHFNFCDILGIWLTCRYTNTEMFWTVREIMAKPSEASAEAWRRGH